MNLRLGVGVGGAKEDAAGLWPPKAHVSLLNCQSVPRPLIPLDSPPLLRLGQGGHSTGTNQASTACPGPGAPFQWET